MRKKMKIFIINNNPFHHFLEIEEILRKIYEVVVFECAGDLLQCIQDECVIPALIITPLIIPTGAVNGAELVLMLKSTAPFIPIIMITELDCFLDGIPADAFQTPLSENNFQTKEFLQKIEHLISRSILALYD